MVSPIIKREETKEPLPSTETQHRVSSAKNILCHFCGQSPPQGRPLCGRCKLIYYCNADCQKADWLTHRLTCRPYDQQDEIGLTPLHYAVLNRQPIPKILRRAFRTVRDSFGGTPKDLFRLLKPPPSPKEVVWESLNEKGEWQPLTQEQFSQKTGGKTFVPWFHATTPEKIIEWHKAIKPGRGFQPSNKAKKLLTAFKKHPPQIALCESRGGGYEVIAKETIPINSVICFRTGEMGSPPQKLPENNLQLEDLYNCLQCIESSNFAGKGIIPEGIPNCFLDLFPLFRGLPVIPAIRASRTIEKGEKLKMDFGSTLVKWGHYPVDPILFEQEVASFCRYSDNFAQLIKYRKGNFNFLEHLPNHPAFMFIYILRTPAVFIRALLQGILDPQKTKEVLRKKEVHKFIKNHVSDIDPNSERFSLIPDAIEKIQTREKKEAGKIIPAVAKLCDRFSVITLLNLLDAIRTDPHFSSRSLPTYEILGELIEPLLSWQRSMTLGNRGDEKEAKLEVNSFTEKFKALSPHQQRFFNNFLISTLTHEMEKDPNSSIVNDLFCLDEALRTIHFSKN